MGGNWELLLILGLFLIEAKIGTGLLYKLIYRGTILIFINVLHPNPHRSPVHPG